MLVVRGTDIQQFVCITECILSSNLPLTVKYSLRLSNNRAAPRSATYLEVILIVLFSEIVDALVPE